MECFYAQSNTDVLNAESSQTDEITPQNFVIDCLFVLTTGIIITTTMSDTDSMQILTFHSRRDSKPPRTIDGCTCPISFIFDI